VTNSADNEVRMNEKKASEETKGEVELLKKIQNELQK
jgi:hypothetical protein